jgi:hypothetical protein
MPYRFSLPGPAGKYDTPAMPEMDAHNLKLSSALLTTSMITMKTEIGFPFTSRGANTSPRLQCHCIDLARSKKR